MDHLRVEHKDLASGRWAKMPFSMQMGNIGSEVSRSIKNINKEKRFKASYNRALELFDLTIETAKAKKQTSKVKETKLAKYEFIDYFNNKKLRTNPDKMIEYYDQFALLKVSRFCQANLEEHYSKSSVCL